MKCSKEVVSWSHLTWVEWLGQTYLAELRPPPGCTHGDSMRMCTICGILPRTLVLVNFMICMGLMALLVERSHSARGF